MKPSEPASPITGRLSAVRERIERADGTALGTGLTLLAAAIAVALIVPLGWLLVEVLSLGPRALELTTADATLEVLGRSLALVALVTGGSVVIGVPLAVLTVQGEIPYRRFWTVAAALPLAIPSYLGAFAALSAFGPSGVLSDALTPLGVTVPTITGFGGAVLVLTLYSYPYVFLTTRASLLSLDATLVEAARTLDCGRWAAFRRVTLPQILPGVAAGALLVALYALSDFGTPNFMNVEVFTQFIYARQDWMPGYAALLSLQLLVVVTLILAVESRIGADDDGAYESRGNRGALNLDLGAWRYPALLVPALTAFVSIALPVGIFALWLTHSGPGYQAFGPAFSWSYGWNSLSVSVLAAVGAILVATPVALRSAMSRSRLAWLADRATYLGYATPGIVLAFALVNFSLDVVKSLYGTLTVLVFAYVVRFAPLAVGSIRTSTRQVDRRLAEASRSLGRSRLETFRSVTLPLIAPGVVTGAALVFLTTMKELPATLLLRPFGFGHTLVTYIWEVRESGLYGRAAIPALVLIAISALSMAVILRGERT